MATFSYSDTTDQNGLIDQVEYHADRVTATNQTIGINRSAAYDQLVKAMRLILGGAAPRRAVDESASDGSGQSVKNANSRTEIELPDDFMRFLSVRLSEWQREVYELVDPRSNVVRLQPNSVTARDTYNPIAAKVATPSVSSGQSLYCWPQDSSPAIDSLVYVPETAPENMPSTLEDAMVLHATGYVLAAEKEQGAEVAFQLADRLLQQIEKGQRPMVQQAYQEVQQQS